MKFTSVNQKKEFMFKRNKVILDGLFELRWDYHARNDSNDMIRKSVYQDLKSDVNTVLTKMHNLFVEAVASPKNYDADDLKRLDKATKSLDIHQLDMNDVHTLLTNLKSVFGFKKPFMDYVKLMTNDPKYSIDLQEIQNHAVTTSEFRFIGHLFNQCARYFMSLGGWTKSNIKSNEVVGQYWNDTLTDPVFTKHLHQYDITNKSLRNVIDDCGVSNKSIYDNKHFYKINDTKNHIHGYIVQCEY